MSNCLSEQTEKRYLSNICVFRPPFTKVYSRTYRILKHAIFIFWHFHIRFVEFYFGFRYYREFPVSHRVAASHLLYQFWFDKVWRKLNKIILARIHVFSQVHAAPNFLLLSTKIASLRRNNLLHTTKGERKNSLRERNDIFYQKSEIIILNDFSLLYYPNFNLWCAILLQVILYSVYE